jgi:hypothetical protein
MASIFRQYAREAMESEAATKDRTEKAAFAGLAVTWMMAAAIEERLESAGFTLSSAPPQTLDPSGA